MRRRDFLKLSALLKCGVSAMGLIPLQASSLNITKDIFGKDNIVLTLDQNGKAIAWPDNIIWPGGYAPEISKEGCTDIFLFQRYKKEPWSGSVVALNVI